jgi:hypothetical protein
MGCGVMVQTGFLANGHFPQVSCQSHLSANDNSDNAVKSGAVYRYLTTEENLS